MNLQQLLQQIEFLFNPQNEIGLVMYFILHTANGFVIKKADISADVRIRLRDQFLTYIQSKFLTIAPPHFANISEADNRKNSAYYFDLEELPRGLEVMAELLRNEEQTEFNFDDDRYEDVYGFVFLLGNEANKIALFKKQYPINLLKRDSILKLFKSDTRLVEVPADIIAINEKFDFMQIDDDVVVINIKTLEKYFDFHEIIKRKAISNLAIIENAHILTDTASLQEMVEDLTFARKVMRVNTDSLVLLLPFATINAFIRHHPKLQNKIRFNEEETRISLDTKVSKELFLKLLGDDFLKSELTNALYDSEIKDRLSNDIAQD